MSKNRRNRRFLPGIGWVKLKRGYVWTLRGDNVRKTNLPSWGSRKYGDAPAHGWD